VARTCKLKKSRVPKCNNKRVPKRDDDRFFLGPSEDHLPRFQRDGDLYFTLRHHMQNRLPQLDGVRGVAILLVMLVNVSERYPALHLEHLVGNGWMGVDLFFALSGFLITGILLDTRGSPDYFKNFYARRALRILPLYYSILLLMFVIIPLLRPSDARSIFERSSPWWAYPLFLQNFLVAVSTRAAGPLGTTWSLAIEEQFYLVWPLIVRYCSYTQLRRIATALILVAIPLTHYLSSQHVLIYSNVFCRQVGLMAGALLALLVRSDQFEPSRYMSTAWIVFAVMFSGAFVSELLDTRWLTFTVVALAASSFIFLALYSEQKWLQTALRNRFLGYTGFISYGLYLTQKIPVDMAQTLHLDRHPVFILPIVFVGSYALATASSFLLEQPFLRMKGFSPERANRSGELRRECTSAATRHFR
jgi:peptidoglycan/LPS O-acetylase OafA/YrhL